MSPRLTTDELEEVVRDLIMKWWDQQIHLTFMRIEVNALRDALLSQVPEMVPAYEARLAALSQEQVAHLEVLLAHATDAAAQQKIRRLLEKADGTPQ